MKRKFTRLSGITIATLLFMVLHMLLATIYVFMFANETLDGNQAVEYLRMSTFRFAFYMAMIGITIIFLLLNIVHIIWIGRIKPNPEKTDKFDIILTSPLWVALLYSGLLMAGFPQIRGYTFASYSYERWRLAIFVLTLVMFVFSCFQLRTFIRKITQEG